VQSAEADRATGADETKSTDTHADGKARGTGKKDGAESVDATKIDATTVNAKKVDAKEVESEEAKAEKALHLGLADPAADDQSSRKGEGGRAKLDDGASRNLSTAAAAKAKAEKAAEAAEQASATAAEQVASADRKARASDLSQASTEGSPRGDAVATAAAAQGTGRKGQEAAVPASQASAEKGIADASQRQGALGTAEVPVAERESKSEAGTTERAGTEKAGNRVAAEEGEGSEKESVRDIRLEDRRNLRRDSGEAAARSDASSRGEQRASGAGAESRSTEALPVVERNVLADTSTRGPLGSKSGTALAAQLRESLNAEIVRDARVVLRGANVGEVRLSIKPEDLGNVRIKLQLQDNHIAGRIIVENASVRDAFEQNLAQLTRAFEDSGLEVGNLEVSVAGERGGDPGHEQPDEQAADRGRDLRALEESVPSEEFVTDGYQTIDLIA
jgi:flagellar hook-length control protein FliK